MQFDILGVYAPQAFRPTEDKTNFYQTVTNWLTSRNDMNPKILIGDWNVRLHGRRQEEERIIGPRTAGRGTAYIDLMSPETLENREMMINLLNEHTLVHMNSQFQHEFRQKVTHRENEQGD